MCLPKKITPSKRFEFEVHVLFIKTLCVPHVSFLDNCRRNSKVGENDVWVMRAIHCFSLCNHVLKENKAKHQQLEELRLSAYRVQNLILKNS